MEFEAHYNAAVRLTREHKPEEADVELERACKAFPSAFAAFGSSALSEGRYDEALDHFSRVWRNEKNDLIRGCTANDIGTILSRLGRIEQAERMFDAGLAITPRLQPLISNKAQCRQFSGDIAGALRWANKCILIDPRYAEGYWVRGITRLLSGDFINGWEDYESRFQLKHTALKRIECEKPLWRGEDGNGRTLLVCGEQGAGDTIMTARFGHELKKRGWKTAFVVQKGLSELVFSTGCWDIVLEAGETLPAFDAHIPSMSLMRVLGITDKTCPSSRYLASERHSLGPGFHVGICWGGSPDHKQDRLRSTSLSQWDPLFEVRGAVWHCLQTGFRTLEMESYPNITRHALDSWQRTSSLIASLDLVITVDTSIAHLAGALGKRVWVLLPFCPDFRWMLTGETSYWYQSARLCRQTERYDWTGVFQRAAGALRNLLDPKASVAATT